MKWIDLNNLFGKLSIGFLSIFASCGGFQSASYYSDGIYSSDNVIVIRNSQPQRNTNATIYSQYFDEKANQYNWEESDEAVALTTIDSLSNDNLTTYRSQPNWGGGNKTTQIIFQNNGWGYNDPFMWGFGSFYDPFMFSWNRPFGFYNRWRWNRFAWGFNSPFYSPYNPYFLNGYYYPYGYGYDPYYANRWQNNRYGDRVNRVQHPRRAYSSNYRGRARAASTPRNISGATQEPIARATNRVSQQGKRTNQATVPNLVSQGRRVNAQRKQLQEQRNRNYIDQVVRSYQNRGYSTQVIQNPAGQGRRISTQNSSSNGASRNSNSTYSSSKNSKSTYTPRRSSSSSPARSSYQSSRRSYSAPARSSYSSARSTSRSSSSSSGGRRRQ